MKDFTNYLQMIICELVFNFLNILTNKIINNVKGQPSALIYSIQRMAFQINAE